MANEVSKDQVVSAVKVMAAVAETIRELKEVPSGHLYAQLMGQMSFESYESIIRTLKRADLVAEKGHVLHWTGPNF